MCTERQPCNSLRSWAAALRGVSALAAVACLWFPSTAWAQAIQDTGGLADDQQIDLALHALRPPVLQPLLYPPATRKGAPDWPLYKQQPKHAQEDFRPPAPVVVPTSPATSSSVPGGSSPQPPQPSPPPPPPPPQPPPQPPPPPCTPNSPNWPNC